MFSEAEADVNSNLDHVTGLILVMARIDGGSSGMLYDNPQELLTDMLTSEEKPPAIAPFSSAAYPAARAILQTMDDLQVAVYALQIDQDNWVLAMLVGPLDTHIALLDETLMQPIVRSITRNEPAALPPSPTATFVPIPT